MKNVAMVLTGFNAPLERKEFEIPALQQGQMLVKIEAAGVCGSDVHMWRGEDPRTPLPIILGHEGVGRVVSIRGNREYVDGRKIETGDLILWNRGMSCGKCYACQVLHEPSLCKNRKVYGINMDCVEQPYLSGCYSQYIILRKHTDIFKVQEGVDPAILVSASCSGATIAHAYDMADLSIGSTVLIQGPGPLGVYATAFAHEIGASEIIVIGGSADRLALCREFGATTVLDRHGLTQEERRQKVFEITGGKGVDLVVEATGAQGTVEEGIKLLRSGGMYLSTGYAQPAGIEKIDFFADVVSKNIKIQGTWVSDTRHTYQAMNLVLKEQEKFSKLISHRFPLEKANEAIQIMASKKAFKAVLMPASDIK